MAVWNRDLIVQKIDKVLGDTKKILTAVSGGTGAVKSVQRGLCNFSRASGENTLFQIEIKINPVNPKKAAVIINNAWESYNVTLISLTSDTLILGTGSYITNDVNETSWQVIEFY